MGSLIEDVQSSDLVFLGAISEYEAGEYIYLKIDSLFKGKTLHKEVKISIASNNCDYFSRNSKSVTLESEFLIFAHTNGNGYFTSICKKTGLKEERVKEIEMVKDLLNK